MRPKINTHYPFDYQELLNKAKYGFIEQDPVVDFPNPIIVFEDQKNEDKVKGVKIMAYQDGILEIHGEFKRPNSRIATDSLTSDVNNLICEWLLKHLSNCDLIDGLPLFKVSFDFDGCLSIPEVQDYAKELISRGVEIWICTSRLSPFNAPNDDWNNDLEEVMDKIGMNPDNIIYTNYSKKFINKSEFLDKKGFLWHLDDDNIELSFIKTDSDVTPIFLFGNKNWKNDCEEVFKKQLEK